MGLFDKFALPISFSNKKTLGIKAPDVSPVLGTAIPYKTLATFELSTGEPKYTGDVPDITMKFYPLD